MADKVHITKRGIQALAWDGDVRQYVEHGTHPLDAKDDWGRHLVSGPKVEAYYSNYMHPGRTTTDIQHSRVLFGPKVRSTLSPEELETKKQRFNAKARKAPY